MFDRSLNAADWKEYINDKTDGVLVETRTNA